ncbi:serine hydrolase domain-containing protein [Asanoa sp. NPDC050611]|uniref:serine hydrolase domain-containing protein n=1 Tax=Asanoa sp. NPDC050611 TaxID=3157098 RepID=UPI0033D3F79D
MTGDVAVGVSNAGTRQVATGATAFRIASLTKACTSTALVLTMRERGIPLDTAVRELLADLDWRADPGITVEHLLGQVSGLRESVDAATAAALGDGPDALTEAARLVAGAGNDRAPGTRWSYYNGNYFLAGAILAALHDAPFETAVRRTLLDPWHLSRTTFETPGDAVTGWDGDTQLPHTAYPRARRPSGGLWSCVPDLLTFGERLIADDVLVKTIRGPRTRPDDPMTYGLGWAVGPHGQLYLNGRLPGYRAAMLLVPEREHVSVVLANQQDALPAAARLLSDLQRPLTGDDLADAIDGFAA